jgi:MarR family transcriptional regulator, lower aerobic nicotinate degradation pathway regulator
VTRTTLPETAAPSLETVEHFIALSYVIQQIIADSVTGVDLSNVQMRLLAILRDREPSMTALGAFLNLEKSSVTGLVDRAEERGLVKRTRPSSDRRAVHVALTARGRALDARLRPAITSRIAQLLAGLSPIENKQLAHVMGSIIASQAPAAS